MSFKTILVHVDYDRRCSARLDYAAQFALAWGAHLTGVHVVPPLRVPSYARAELGSDFIVQQEKRMMERSEELSSSFSAAMRRHGLVGHEWRAVHGEPHEVIGVHARYADLIIAGQRDRTDDTATVGGEFPEIVAMTAGRPLIVFPYAGNFAPIAKHIMVCWNASRESTRAVTDALPALQRAEKVTVMSVNAKSSTLGHGEHPGSDLALYLARHKVKAEVSTQAAVDIDIGDFILSRAADLGADMIVMGAYGHPRMREMIFGGVTRNIMQHMTVPVLLSH